ncbi:MAG: MGMT family protein [Gemmatimonadota bacterium]|nr:MGMT family protein [Gemmatimonadota bacterium]
MPSESYERIYEAVRLIPPGRVATYGQVAQVAGLGRHARMVGYALHACDEDVPWHRVINARGEISARSDPFYEGLQRERLEEEGVAFDDRGRIPLARFRWEREDSLEDPRQDPSGDPLVDPGW